MILSNFSQRCFSRLPYILPIVMAQGLCSGSSNPRCLRLQNVTGVEGKRNDVIVCSPEAEDWKSSKQHIIFFGGDVQDFRENMERHYVNKNYAEWNLETTAELLHSKFQHSTIFVVKPAEMLINTFSIYRNFLRFDQDGRPEFTHDYGGLVHLAKLYRSAVGRLYESEENGVCEGIVENSECSIPVKLMGFSKGCVVLTQLMHELSSYKDNEEVQAFLKKVSAIYWLDGGHTGGVKAYITDDDILKEIAGLGKELFVLVTPYQIKDVNRKWIGREEAEFVKKLKALKANIREFRFYMDDPPSIDNHFKVLTQVE